MADAYIAVWELIPELSLYQAGDAPASGRYEIAEAAGRIEFRVQWTDSSGAAFAMSFGGPADGSAQSLPTRPGSPATAPDTMTIARIDRQTLDSEAFAKGQRVAYARRKVSHDGSLLSVVQEAALPDGRSVRNFQVYRRVYA
ncbi:MAG TPA: hypothetical protein VKB34_22055 [Povalibacter sp.]|nr:hypothetical protein [Povalibacter sp.]